MTSDIFTLAELHAWASAPKLTPRRLFRASHGDVYLSTARLSPEVVDGLLTLFQRERAWSLFDDLLAARDGATEPPEAA